MRHQTSLLKGTPILFLKNYKSKNQTTVTTIENTGMNNIDNIKCTRFKHLQKVLVSSFCHFIESNEATEYLSLFSPNRSFAPCHSPGTKPPSWDAKVALGQDKQRKLPCKIMYAFVGLASVRILRPSMAVLYHVYGKLQRAYISLLIIACHLPHYPK